eukprot:TRINITY_DN14299_c0_g1_i1.p1 TRINITY_DN14299_c0_g1~~TRINITY_DN14299_c0_g1_i1.p1  ORF type:complete len:118 (+),score=17.71 TRINITY_DN14299_c0_g1_i1:61-414(+)
MTSLSWFQLGALSAGLSVALGAFGAHGLKSRVSDPNLLKTWETAAHYHMIHSIALVICGVVPRNTKLPATLFTTGIALFSGSLYLLVLSKQKWLGAITPLGGTALIAGWISLVMIGN